MNPNLQAVSYRYCGRIFTVQDIAWIRNLIAAESNLHRTALSERTCSYLQWFSPNGRLKSMSCRVAMLRMHRDGLISLPPSRRKNINAHRHVKITHESDPQPQITMPAGSLGQLHLQIVNKSKDSSFWNQLIERYHYLGHKPLPGAQLRYLVFSEKGTLLAALGFGAAAWKTAPRDQFIGWSHEHRIANLHLIVNNARFLILPWITSHNLASRILAKIAKQLPIDWQKVYNYSPVLLETFVEKDRFKGTCYKAANWICLGQTKGRGKLDRYNLYLLPIKDIFVYPLHKSFRKILCSH